MIDWHKIESARTAQKVAPLPDNFFTPQMYAEKVGIPLNTARGRIYDMYQAGKLARQRHGKGFIYALKE